MKKNILKQVKYLASAFIAGVFLFSAVFFNGFFYKTAQCSTYTFLNNNCVQEVVEFLKTQKLTLHGEKQSYSFTYPEINFYVVSVDKKNNIKYYLCGKEQVLQNISDCENIPAKDSEIEITQDRVNRFIYSKSEKGKSVDLDKLNGKIEYVFNNLFVNSLQNFKSSFLFKNNNTVEEIIIDIPYLTTYPKISEEQAKKDTTLVSRFTTYFDADLIERSENIRLACSKINGKIIYPNEVFSFNTVVGKRTVERGFKKAKIIYMGEFIEGVGGGVCQVSTTIYNCALLSGLKIIERRPHSMPVSYVGLSFDAMVNSSTSDLKILNNKQSPVYFFAHVNKNALVIELYGRKDDFVYERESVVKKSNEKEVISEGKLKKYLNGKMVEEIFISRDSYSKPQIKDEVLETPKTDKISI